MNMRKNENFTPKKQFYITSFAKRILSLGMIPIYASLLRLLFELRAAGTLTEAAARYYGGMLEYPVAALALLSAAAFLADRVARSEGLQ